MKLTLIIPARAAANFLSTTVEKAAYHLRAYFPGNFEILLIPNGKVAAPDALRDATIDPEFAATIAEALRLAEKFPEARVILPETNAQGKGASLRLGMAQARGRAIYYTDADLPYDLHFINRTLPQLEGGADLVTANRRAPQSYFDLPLDLLRVAYRRHRLGRLFNSVARLLFGLRTADTQAGFKGLSPRLAQLFLLKTRCAGFFFDLELFLLCRGHRFRAEEFPVSLRLESEKSTIQVFRQMIEAIKSLTRLKLLAWRGHYDAPALSLRGRFREASLFHRVFVRIRYALTPYAVIASYLPKSGTVIDLGCGHGLLSATLAHASQDLKVKAVDHDELRINSAKRSFSEFTNLDFSTADITQSGVLTDANGLAIIDTLHYFSFSEQEELLRKIAQQIARGTRLVIREVEPARSRSRYYSGWRSWANQLYEKCATGMGFTRSKRGTKHFFRSAAEWERLLKGLGFEVMIRPVSRPPFADLLFIATKITQPTREGSVVS